MPASSRPFRSALIRDEGSTRSAPPSTPMSLSADGWMQVASFIVFTASLLAPSVASPGLLERSRCSPDRPGWWFTLSSYGAHYP